MTEFFQLTNDPNSKKTKLAMFTLPFPGVPNGKVYIINSPALRHAVYKDNSRFSLRHVESIFTPKMAGLSSHATKILGEYVDIGEAKPSYLKDGLDNVDNSMLPCQELHDNTKTALTTIVKVLERSQHKKCATVVFEAWVRDIVTTSATRSIFGVKNPYNEHGVPEAFW
jgi:hypothetical protein